MASQLTLSTLDGAAPPAQEPLAPGAVVLRRFIRARALNPHPPGPQPPAAGEPIDEPALLADLAAVVAAAPFRHMITPGGFRMSAEMTNCGALGWVSDRTGYRYAATDPDSGRAWPPMPASFRRLATGAALAAGFPGFVPDACLVNRYQPGARLTLHQDKNEHDFAAPIVSVSLGIPAVFLFGGTTRADRPLRVRLAHGDVVVWGGPARLRYHGVRALQEDHHPLVGGHRINLTLRKAG